MFVSPVFLLGVQSDKLNSSKL